MRELIAARSSPRSVGSRPRVTRTKQRTIASRRFLDSRFTAPHPSPERTFRAIAASSCDRRR